MTELALTNAASDDSPAALARHFDDASQRRAIFHRKSVFDIASINKSEPSGSSVTSFSCQPKQNKTKHVSGFYCENIIKLNTKLTFDMPNVVYDKHLLNVLNV